MRALLWAVVPPLAVWLSIKACRMKLKHPERLNLAVFVMAVAYLVGSAVKIKEKKDKFN